MSSNQPVTEGVSEPAFKKPKFSTASLLAASVAHLTPAKPIATTSATIQSAVAAPVVITSASKSVPLLSGKGELDAQYRTLIAQSQSLNKTAAPAKATKAPKAAKQPKVAAKDLPHVLIWVCHCGPNQSGKWTNNSLKIVGVYGSKAEAERKKDEVMGQYENCGHGDILVGGTCWDEIDLVVRPAGECTL